MTYTRATLKQTSGICYRPFPPSCRSLDVSLRGTTVLVLCARQDHKLNSALMVAATRGNVASVALLLGARPPAAVDLPRDDGATPLMMACYEGRAEVVSALLKGRPDVNRQVVSRASHAGAL